MGAEGVELLNCLLTYDPEKRMTARQALRHPFFTKKDDRYPVVLPRGYKVDRNWGWLRGVVVVDGAGGEGGGQEGKEEKEDKETEWLRRMGGLRGMIWRVLHGES